MRNTLFLSGLMALCCGAGMAATVAIDLNGEATSGTSLPTAIKWHSFGDVNSQSTITASKVVSWLQNTTGWKGTSANGNTGTTIYGSVTASGDTDVLVTFINRNAYDGSIVGTAVTLTSDYASYTWIDSFRGLRRAAILSKFHDAQYRLSDGRRLADQPVGRPGLRPDSIRHDPVRGLERYSPYQRQGLHCDVHPQWRRKLQQQPAFFHVSHR